MFEMNKKRMKNEERKKLFFFVSTHGFLIENGDTCVVGSYANIYFTMCECVALCCRIVVMKARKRK